MAGNEVQYNLRVEDQGGTLKKRNEEAKELNQSLSKAAELSERALRARSAAARRAPQGEGTEYGRSRAAIGTGAEARDFANQAQGLGGLVRVYATFAANLFAVSAAFTALSNAADTSNMVKGLDQLGAASGRNLGTLAKRLVDVTDGAISFRDAIEATSKGAAAGLNNKQLLQMAEVAKKASQAVGVSLPDALSRLTRGVSKLEPELLDELGLYTKLDKAAEDYARSIGKPTSALTDLERRQAFANATIKEGLDKFADIDMAANPYDKLLASLKNVAQTSLELVNKVLTPLVTLLSSSPTGLAAVLGGIGILLLKQAIPALGKYRENLQAAAEESRLRFMKIYKDQQASLGDMAGQAAVSASAAYRASSKVLAEVKQLEKTGAQFTDTARTKWSQIAAKDPFELTPQEIKSLEGRVKTLARTNQKEADDLKEHLQNIKRLRAGAETAGDIAQARIEKGTTGALTTAGSNDLVFRREMVNTVRDNIKSTVAETQALYGASAAHAKLTDEINKAKAGMQQIKVGTDAAGNAIMQAAPKMGRFDAAVLKVSGTVGIVTRKIGSLLNAFSPYLIGIGLAVEAFNLLDTFVSKTTRQQDAFEKSLVGVEDAADNATRTIDTLSKKNVTAAATISGVFALSNAFGELTNATDQALYSAKKLADGLDNSTWDSAKNSILKLFGADLDTKLADRLNTDLQSSLQLFAKYGRGEEAKAAFKKALGLESLDTGAVKKVFKDSAEAREKFATAQKDLNTEIQQSSVSLQTFKSATEASNKAYQEFIQSTASRDPLFKLGESLQNISIAAQDVLRGGIDKVNAAFDDLVKNPEKFTLFGKTFIDQFVAIRAEFTATFAAQQQYANDTFELDKKIDREQAAIAQIRAARAGATGRGSIVTRSMRAEEDATARLASLRAQKDTLIAPDVSVFERVTKIFSDGMLSAFTTGSDLIDKALGQASQRAAITIAQAKIGGLTGEAQARQATELKQKELKLQLDAIDTNIRLITSQEELKTSIDLANAIAQAQNTEGKSEAQVNLDKANLQATAIFKSLLEESKGNKQLALQKTGIDIVDALVSTKIVSYNRQIAQQQAARTGVVAQQGAETIAGARAIRAAQLQDLERTNSLLADITQQETARLSIGQNIAGAASVEAANQAIILENETLETKQVLERQRIEEDIRNAKIAGDAAAQQRLKVNLQLVTDRQKAETDNKGLQDRNKLIDIAYDKEKQIRDLAFSRQDLGLKGQQEEVSRQQELLNLQNSLGIISQTEFQNKRDSLAFDAIRVEYARQQLKLTQDRSAALADIDSRIEKAPGTGADIDRLKKERAGILERYTTEAEQLEKSKQGKLEILRLDQSMSDQMKGFSRVVIDSLDKAADAFVDFVKTGKFNFKSLVDMMLTELLRLAIQNQFRGMFGAAGGLPGISGFLGNIFGFGTQAAAGPSMGEIIANTAALGNWQGAKGGAFDAGVLKFAKGGMFTNTIVNEPTNFKFAKGTGLMGEAGPEAIMPLRRDGNGNLGVMATPQSGNVEVVVNNYSSESAQAKETVDSRGNRKIEVIVGEMVANEVGRKNSPVQQSLMNNFMARPATIRR